MTIRNKDADRYPLGSKNQKPAETNKKKPEVRTEKNWLTLKKVLRRFL